MAQICARPDAPAYILAPVARETKLDPALGAQLWTPPAVRVEIGVVGESVQTTRFEAYAIIDCALHR